MSTSKERHKVVWGTRSLIATMLLVVGLSSAPMHAQQQPTAQPPNPSAAQEGFVPVGNQPAQQETIPASRLVGLAYGFIWVMLLGYLWSIWSRLSRVERDLESVSRRVTSGGRSA